jgi:hypothetical protein
VADALEGVTPCPILWRVLVNTLQKALVIARCVCTHAHPSTSNADAGTDADTDTDTDTHTDTRHNNTRAGPRSD